MPARVLVAGVGNLFLGDDGFGPEVVRRLAPDDLPPGVRAVDYGIRGVHLAYDLLDGYDVLVLVDALPGTPAGELVILDVTAAEPDDDGFDAHGMNPAATLAALDRLGGTRPVTYLVGCRVASVTEAIGLSEPVAAAVPAAVRAVVDLVRRLPAGRP